MQKSTPLLKSLSMIMAWALFVQVLSPSLSLLPSAYAAMDDYTVEGGDPSTLPAVGTPPIPLGLITLTDVDGDDFSNIDGTEVLEVALNTTDYSNVEFDTTTLSGGLTIGGSCGHTSASALTFPDVHTAQITLSGAGGGSLCATSSTITISGLQIKTTAVTPAPIVPAHLITVDNTTTSTGSPVPSSTQVSYEIPAPDAFATMTFSTPAIGNVGDATLTMTVPTPLTTSDEVKITFPGNFNLSGIQMATTGTLAGGVNSFNCTAFGQVVTCNPTGNTNTTGTIIMSGVIATGGSTDDVVSVVAQTPGFSPTIIAADYTVPTTDIPTLSDNLITDISVEDSNHNGKIDRIILSVDNNSGNNAASHSTNGWAVTNNSNAVTISSVNIDGSANAHPLKIHVNLDENDTDLTANNTTTTNIELTYTPQGVDSGFEFDDFADTQLSSISAGDTDATNTENDKAAPVLTSWDNNITDGKIVMNWSENISLASVVAAKLILQNAATGTTSYTLTGGTTSQATLSSLTLTTTPGDKSAIDGNAGLLKSLANSFLRLDAGFLQDSAGNATAAIADGNALQASTITTPPTTTTPTYSGSGGGFSAPSNTNTNSNLHKSAESGISNATITLSDTTEDARNVLMKVSFTSEKDIPSNAIFTINLPGYTFTSENPPTSRKDELKSDSIGVRTKLSGSDIVIQSIVPAKAGKITYTIQGVINPKARAAISNHMFSIYAEDGTTFIASTNIMTSPAIVAAPTPAKNSITLNSTEAGVRHVTATVRVTLTKPVYRGGIVLISFPGGDTGTIRNVTFTTPSLTKVKFKYDKKLQGLVMRVSQQIPAGELVFSLDSLVNPSTSGEYTMQLKTYSSSKSRDLLETITIPLPTITDTKSSLDGTIKNHMLIAGKRLSSNNRILITGNATIPPAGKIHIVLPGFTNNPNKENRIFATLKDYTFASDTLSITNTTNKALSLKNTPLDLMPFTAPTNTGNVMIKMYTTDASGNILEKNDHFAFYTVAAKRGAYTIDALEGEQLLKGSITLSSTYAGMENVTATTTLQLPRSLNVGEKIALTFPEEMSLNEKSITTFTTPNKIKHTSDSTEESTLILTLEEAVPKEEIRFNFDGITLPGAGQHNIKVEILDQENNTDESGTLSMENIIPKENITRDLVINKPVTTTQIVENTISVNMNSNASNTNINSSTALTGAHGQITLKSTGGSVIFSENTNVNASSGWDGVIHAPQNINRNSLPEVLEIRSENINGNNNSNSIRITQDQINTAVTVGSTNSNLSFSKPVKVTIPVYTNALPSQFKASLLEDMAKAMNINSNRIAITSVLDVVHVNQNTNTATTVSSNKITIVPCSGTACETSAQTPRPTVLTTSTSQDTCSQSSSSRLSGITIIEYTPNTTGTFLFGQQMRASNNDTTQTITRPGFSTTGQNSMTPTLRQDTLLSLSTNVCHFSTYAIVVRDTRIVSLDSLKLYPDVEANHPSVNAIQSMKSEKIMTGYEDGNFRPDLPMNRAEFLKTLMIAKYGALSENQADTCFSDIAQDAWYAPYVCAGKKRGLISGYDSGNFDPEKNINLAEAAKMITEVFDIPQDKADPEALWYESYLLALKNQEILPLSLTSPLQQVTRSDMAEMIWRTRSSVQRDVLEDAV